MVAETSGERLGTGWWGAESGSRQALEGSCSVEGTRSGHGGLKVDA